MNTDVPKVLTLWQPWATLYVHKIKKLETRPKETSHRGTYLIHSAQKWSKEQAEICIREPFKSALVQIGYLHKHESEDDGYKGYYFSFPMGFIIGAVDIERCAKIYSWSDGYFWIHNHEMVWTRIIEPELSFGDYTPGRFAWLGSNHRILMEPIPYKNGQGYYLPFKGDGGSKLIFKK